MGRGDFLQREKLQPRWRSEKTVYTDEICDEGVCQSAPTASGPPQSS